MWALCLFVAGSVACALAPTLFILICARALQGFGGGSLMTLAQALLGEVVSPKERGRIQGWLGANQKSTGITYSTVSKSGSSMWLSRAIDPALESEREVNDVTTRHQVTLTADNYEFEVDPAREVNGRDCFVLNLKPRKKESLPAERQSVGRCKDLFIGSHSWNSVQEFLSFGRGLSYYSRLRTRKWLRDGRPRGNRGTYIVVWTDGRKD